MRPAITAQEGAKRQEQEQPQLAAGGRHGTRHMRRRCSAELELAARLEPQPQSAGHPGCFQCAIDLHKPQLPIEGRGWGCGWGMSTAKRAGTAPPRDRRTGGSSRVALCTRSGSARLFVVISRAVALQLQSTELAGCVAVLACVLRTPPGIPRGDWR
jgi:hypothetical protein